MFTFETLRERGQMRSTRHPARAPYPKARFQQKEYYGYVRWLTTQAVNPYREAVAALSLSRALDPYPPKL